LVKQDGHGNPHRRGLFRISISTTELEVLSSLIPSLAALLVAAAVPAVALRLLGLSGAAISGFASYLAGLAHVVAILNHVRAAQSICLVSILWHTDLLSPRT
jgi:hypothetical protein